MKKYPNLPSVLLYLIDGGERVAIDSGLPKAAIFGTIANNYFADGTPIQFNEPYLIPDVRSISEMFSGTGSLYNNLTKTYMGCGDSAVPVAVRVGYPLSVPDNIAVEDIALENSAAAALIMYVETAVTAESLSSPYTSFTLASHDLGIVPSSVTLTVDATTSVIDDGEGLLSGTGFTGTINYDTGAGTLVGTVSASVTASYHYIAYSVYPVMSAEVKYAPSFNGEYVVKVSEIDTDVYASGTPTAIAGVKLDVSINGGLTYDYTDQPMDEPIYLKEAGVEITFDATHASELLALNYAYSFDLNVRKMPVSNDELYKALQDGYDAADMLDAAVVVASDTYLDATFTTFATAVHDGDLDKVTDMTAADLNFGYQLARYCSSVTEQQRFCIGFIGVTEPPAFNITAVKEWAETLASVPSFTTGFFKTADNTMVGSPLVDSAGKPIDIGAHISIIPAWGLLPGANGVQDASAYIGNYLYFRAGDQLVNVTVPGFVPSYSLPKKIVDTLIGLKMTPIFQEYYGGGKQSKVAVCRTAATSDSSFTKLSTIRVLNEVATLIRTIANRYLGKPNSPKIRSVLESELNSALKAGVSLGKYADSYVSVKSEGLDEILGKILIYGKLKAYSEIQDVEIYLTYEYANQ